ncbi:MAG TPA: hypothetical protein V6D08_05820 [Candidatus Obscuribacterales bacterium]
MTSAIAQKTPVQIKWPIEKVQEGAARALANHLRAAQTVLAKYGPEVWDEYDRLVLKDKLEYYKSVGVKTPIELVKAMAEFESNVFGSKIQIVGDDKKASLTYDSCGIYNAMQKFGTLTPEQEEKIGSYFERCVSNLAKEFGFKGEVKFEEPCAIVTFTK